MCNFQASREKMKWKWGKIQRGKNTRRQIESRK